MIIPERIQSIAAPIIQEIDIHKRELLRQGKPVIDLGQGLVNLPSSVAFPPTFEQAYPTIDVNAYSPGVGLPILRQAICDDLSKVFNANVNPASELIVTAGANQAFLLTLLTLLSAGDRVLLPSPYYFNHEMSVRMVGGIPVEVPLSEKNHFKLTLEDLLPYLEQSPRFLVIVSPNNPTGAVYEPKEIGKIAQVAAERNITVIADEAYNYLVYSPAALFSTASLDDFRQNIVTISSFSKTFSMAGWRIGYVVGSSEFIKQAVKVQDCMVICPPIVSQLLAHYNLLHGQDGIEQRHAQLDERRRLMTRSLGAVKNLTVGESHGACYVFVRVEGCHDSLQLAHDLLEEAHVTTIPGNAFGNSGEGFLRLSYGAVDMPDIEAACERMAHYFENQKREL